MSSRRGAAAAAAVMVLSVLGACGTDDPGEPADGAAWMTSTQPVDTSPVVWAADGVVHLADGAEIDLGTQPSSYVVAGDGVFFVPAEDAQEAETGSDVSAEVHFVAPQGDPAETGLLLKADSLRASSDGRYLLGIDMESGPEDDYGTPLAELVVRDLVEGREVVRTSEGLGDTSGDLTDLYEEAEIGVFVVTDEVAYIDGTSGLFSVGLDTGSILDPEVDLDEEPPSQWVPESPDGRWRIEAKGKLSEVVDSEGDVVPLEVDAVRWRFDWWADEVTVVGIAGAEDGSSALVTCVVPEGLCEVHEATRGESVRFPNGPHNLVTNFLGASDD